MIRAWRAADGVSLGIWGLSAQTARDMMTLTAPAVVGLFLRHSSISLACLCYNASKRLETVLVTVKSCLPRNTDLPCATNCTPTGVINRMVVGRLFDSRQRQQAVRKPPQKTIV
jgi:hypothetical protein